MQVAYLRRIRISTVLAVGICILVNLSELYGLKGGLQLASYLDSNVRESVDLTEPALGLKLRGNLAHYLSGSKWRIDGNLLVQTYIDLLSPAQSKLIVNSGLAYFYNLFPRIQIKTGYNHFQKSFYRSEYSYRWSDYHLALNYQVTKRLLIRPAVSKRLTIFTTLDSIRLVSRGIDLTVRYLPTRHWLIEGTVRSSVITFRNYPAWGVLDDTSFSRLAFDQRDKGRHFQLHGRYQGQIIAGVRGRYEYIASNSVTGSYQLVSGRAYISFRLGQAYMVHFILQRVSKTYDHQNLSGISTYRDPEERIQNRTYLQLERKLALGGIGYIQLSRLANETILNQQYYDKTIVEMGIKLKI